MSEGSMNIIRKSVLFYFLFIISTWNVVLFIKSNSIQHVPTQWCQIDKEVKCWFPYTKQEFPSSKVHFNNKSIQKMIKQLYKPNNTDGSWFDAKILAGPLGNILKYINIKNIQYIIKLIYR